LHRGLKKRLKQSCLQRDLYLDVVLRHEAQMLDKEVLKPNSSKGRLHLKQCLQRLETTPVSLALSEETVDLINDVCARKLIPRDSFINRVLLFLVLDRDHFGILLGIDIPEIIRFYLLDDCGSELAFESTAVGLSLISQSVNNDPFWSIRQCIVYSNQDASGNAELLHQVFIDEHFPQLVFKDEELNLLGLNCFVDDSRIDGTIDNIDLHSLFDDLLPSKTDSVKNKRRKSA
jgi:hypothetical protein